MRYFKIYTNFTNYIPIDEGELEKAFRAFQKGLGVIFQNGATQRIESIIPDDVKMMGWNDGYKPTSEELGEISRNKVCISARRLMASVKDHLALNSNERFKEIASPTTKIYTKEPTSLAELLPHLKENL